MSKKRILIIGATGMAGHVIYSYLNNLKIYNLSTAVFRNKLTESCIIIDVTKRRDVCRLVNEIKPDFIINCVGVLVNGSSKNPDNAIFINAYFPHLLAKLANGIGAKVIHISTDCVFLVLKVIIQRRH